MRILIAGGSGLLGRPLILSLAARGHEIRVLSRGSRLAAPAHTPGPQTLPWLPDGSLGPWADHCGPIDVVINLAGASIGDGRWSATRKADLVASRLNPTQSLVRFIQHASPRPSLLINASAIGYYGDRGSDVLTEDIPAGSDFLATLCRDWESVALAAHSTATRVVVVRTGIVLDPNGGALAKMLPPFKLFAGGPFGSGRQFMSWIHRDDWVSLVLWMLGAPEIAGAVNATAPTPVTNREFVSALGHALHRPAWLAAPGFALRLALGEMAEPLLLFSQRVMPERATRAGFAFRYATLDAALANLLG